MEFPFFLKSLLIIFIFSVFPASRCEEGEGNFTACVRPYECGNIKNLSFPFWGDSRPESCGHPGFKLRCIEGEYPVIDISGSEYRVLNVSQENRTMTLARSDLWDTPCSVKGGSTTLNYTFFVSYPETVENLILIYDCPKHESLGTFFNSSNNFSCPGYTDDRISYYVRESLRGTFNDNVVDEVCDKVIQVPVFRSVLDEIERSAESGAQEVSDAVKKGFDVRYTDFPLCSDCEREHRRCGTNITTGLLICYCPDGTYNSCLRSSGNSLGWRVKVAIGVGLVIVLFLICIMTCCLGWKKSIKCWTKMTENDQDLEAFIRSYGHLAAKRFRYLDVKKMTKSFKEKLGQGGYGEVYKGELHDRRLVAVKILNGTKGNGEEFINEVASISRTSHINIVTLLGFCLEGHKRALIYEFMANGSLEKFTFKDNPSQTSPRLEWKKLLHISISIARGLEYLHHGCNTKILHLDIKPHNILLDEDFCPKIADFGLAKLCPRKDSIISMADARGTIGYIAPEVFSRNFGGVSSKSDVYSYGMMILEMVGGRKNLKVRVSRTSEIYFPDWIYKHIELGSTLQLWGDMTSEENKIARKMALVGLWCIQTKPSDRPSMSKVVEMLDGSLEALHIPPNPCMFSPTSPKILPAEPSAESSTTSLI